MASPACAAAHVQAREHGGRASLLPLEVTQRAEAR